MLRDTDCARGLVRRRWRRRQSRVHLGTAQRTVITTARKSMSDVARRVDEAAAVLLDLGVGKLYPQAHSAQRALPYQSAPQAAS